MIPAVTKIIRLRDIESFKSESKVDTQAIIPRIVYSWQSMKYELCSDTKGR